MLCHKNLRLLSPKLPQPPLRCCQSTDAPFAEDAVILSERHNTSATVKQRAEQQLCKMQAVIRRASITKAVRHGTCCRRLLRYAPPSPSLSPQRRSCDVLTVGIEKSSAAISSQVSSAIGHSLQFEVLSLDEKSNSQRLAQALSHRNRRASNRQAESISTPAENLWKSNGRGMVLSEMSALLLILLCNKLSLSWA